MNKKLERKRFRTRNEEGELIADISAISIVTQPAIEKDFQLFNAIPGAKKSNFKVTNEEKMEITGPAMVSDLDILRFDEEKKEYYYCYFTKEDVEDYAELFMQKANTRQANFEHQEQFTDKVFVKECWLCIDPEKDKSAALGFKDVDKDAITWFITYKCTDAELWQAIKRDGFKGFSVEISLAEFAKEEADVEMDIENIVDELTFSREEKQDAIKDIVAFHHFVPIGELSFKDYPQAAVQNAIKALEYKNANPDSTCGNNLMWVRCKQIASNQPLSYSALKRISLALKSESKANAAAADYGCAKLMWDAFGGTELIYWANTKLNQIDAIIKAEADKTIAQNKTVWPFR